MTPDLEAFICKKKILVERGQMCVFKGRMIMVVRGCNSVSESERREDFKCSSYVQEKLCCVGSAFSILLLLAFSKGHLDWPAIRMPFSKLIKHQLSV